MSVNDIIKTIEEQADKKSEEIRKKNKEKEYSLILAYNEKITAQEAALLDKAKKETKEKVRKEKFILNLNENNALLEKKWEIIDSVYKKALDKFIMLDKKEKGKIFSHWLKECYADGEIIISEKDVEIIEKLANAKKIKISPEKIKNAGGFIFKSDKTNIDYTFENVVNNLRKETEVEVGKILFSFC